MSIEKFSANSVIFLQGDDALDFLIIKKGVVRVVRKKGNTLEVIGVRKEKEFLGEHSLFLGAGVRSLSAIAESDTKIIRIPYKDMLEAIKTCPEWVSNLMSSLVGRSKSLHNMLIEHRIDDDETSGPFNLDLIPAFQNAIKDYVKEKGLD